LAEFNEDGSLDSSFGASGRVLTDFGSEFEGANAVALQADGRAVVAGTANYSDRSVFALARYLGPLPHTLTFYLHGNDAPKTAGGFTMDSMPGSIQTLGLNLLKAPAWFSQPVLNGTFLPDAAFKVVVARTTGLDLAMTFRLSKTNPDGSGEQVLGQVTQGLGLGLGPRTVMIPVPTPLTLAHERLKLTISSGVNLNVSLQTTSSYLEATSFFGVP
jgi:hypothetical protein